MFISTMSKITKRDPDGYYYQEPNRTCKECAKNPCIKGQELLWSDFARYGCLDYISIDEYCMERAKHPHDRDK